MLQPRRSKLVIIFSIIKAYVIGIKYGNMRLKPKVFSFVYQLEAENKNIKSKYDYAITKNQESSDKAHELHIELKHTLKDAKAMSIALKELANNPLLNCVDSCTIETQELLNFYKGK